MPERPKQEDVARLAGVSRSTVSFVLNNRTENLRISEETRQKVLDAARALGYQPSYLARSLRAGASHSIGLLLPSYYNPHYWKVLDAAAQEITSHGYHLMLTISNMNLEQEQQCVRSLLNQRLEGLILIPNYLQELLHDLQLSKNNAKQVVFTVPVEGWDWVTPDIRHGADLMMDHLLSLGHQRIGFINGTVRRHLTKSREDAYREKLAAAKLPVSEELICQCGYRIEDGYQAAKRLLDLPHPPTAIWAINDYLAMGVLRAAHERGLRIPEDLAVAGYDDNGFADQFWPPLTTVDIASREMGRRAAQVLFERIKNPEADIFQEVIPTRLMIRQSTAGLSAPVSP